MNLSDRNRLPLKTYSMLVTAASWTTIRAIGVPYQTLDGSWRLKFNFCGTYSGASVQGIQFSIAGITFKNIGGNSGQACAYSAFAYGTGGAMVRCLANNNAGTIDFSVNIAFTAAGFQISGDVELDSKPLWVIE